MQYYDKLECSRETLWGAYIPQTVFYMAPEELSPDQLIYYVNRGGIVKQTPPDFQIARHDTYPYTQISCVVSGQGSLTMAGREYPLSAGQVFLLPSYESHEYRSEPDNPMGLAWLEFAGGSTDALAREILQKNGPIFEGETFDTLLDLCTEFLIRPSRGKGIRSSMLVYEILLRLSTCPDHGVGKKAQLADEIYNYLNTHLREGLRMADVAREFGYNASYFSVLFSELFGMSFTKYLLQCRITKARYLLTSTNLPLETIAGELGFYDTSHFIQRFREVEKLSPSQYRKVNSGETGHM